MDYTVTPPSKIDQSISLPGDKSISIRALILNTMANGSAHISNLCEGDDRISILRCLVGLGSQIDICNPCPEQHRGDCFNVVGKGSSGLVKPTSELDAGNSGTTMRLLTGLLAAQPFTSVISGDESLRSRPMGRIIQPLSLMGATISGKKNNTLAPLVVQGKSLTGIDYLMPQASAQVKSSILIAGLNATGKTTVHQPAKSRDHTERMMRFMGANIEEEGLSISVTKSELVSKDVIIPGDASGAAFWIVAGCCHPNARILLKEVGINPSRIHIIDVLKSMGASIEINNVREDGPEPIADILVKSSELVGTTIEGNSIPYIIDEIPVLAIAATMAKGTTVFSDAAELRLKESDRIRATADGINSLGGHVEEHKNGLTIHGTKTLTGSYVNSYGDHRIAMAMGIAGLIGKGKTVVSGAEAAAISYPDFWKILDSLCLIDKV